MLNTAKAYGRILILKLAEVELQLHYYIKLYLIDEYHLEFYDDDFIDVYNDIVVHDIVVHDVFVHDIVFVNNNDIDIDDVHDVIIVFVYNIVNIVDLDDHELYNDNLKFDLINVFVNNFFQHDIFVYDLVFNDDVIVLNNDNGLVWN